MEPTDDMISRRDVVLGSLAWVALTGLLSSETKAQPFQRLRDRIRARRVRGEDNWRADPAAIAGLEEFGAPGRFPTIAIAGVWQDAARSRRAVPWKLYLPEVANRSPIAIYSHGGGGTRESGAMFGEHLASHGIASLHLQHLGSDRDAFRADRRRISEASRNPLLAEPRFADIGFAAQMMRGGDEAVAGRVNGSHLAVYGHSFGAITAQVAAGQWVEGLGRKHAVSDLRAAVLLSPSPPRAGYGSARDAFARMNAPLLHLTGSEDDAPNGDFDARERLVPFAAISNVEQHLLFLKGANHFTFGGDPDPRLGPRSFAYPGLARDHALIRATMAASLRAQLLNDTIGADYLKSGGTLFAQLDSGDRLDHRAATTAQSSSRSVP